MLNKLVDDKKLVNTKLRKYEKDPHVICLGEG